MRKHINMTGLEKLSRQELKKIVGGDISPGPSVSCTVKCSGSSDLICYSYENGSGVHCVDDDGCFGYDSDGQQYNLYC